MATYEITVTYIMNTNDLVTEKYLENFVKEFLQDLPIVFNNTGGEKIKLVASKVSPFSPMAEG